MPAMNSDSLQTQSGRNICFVTLGCAKNEVDTTHMQEKVVRAGYCLVDEPSRAHAVVVNTCSFIREAIEESLETIFDLADLATVRSGDTKLIVAGCMPSRFGEELEAELYEAHTFVPCAKEEEIVSVLNDVLGCSGPLPGGAACSHASIAASNMRAPLHSAYLKISEGCNRFCSYCTIPFIRGRYRSFTWEDIYADAQASVAAGARELVLIAQDTGRWGLDLDEPSSLPDLLEKLAVAFPTTWLRVMYIQPEGICDRLLETIKRHDTICTYLDIPLQHVDSTMLTTMNRTGSRDEFLSLISHIRTVLPDVTIRTTLIAGFPGEDEERFTSLCDFVEEAEFDYVGVFPYSPEEGTKAYGLPDQIDEETRLERAQMLRDTADAISTRRVQSRKGKRLDVLVIGSEEDGQLYGRAQCQAPDVDGVVFLEHGTPGTIVPVTVMETLWYEMEAR